MKDATGSYLNLFSSMGYDNLGLKDEWDIFIIFKEYMGDDIDFIKVTQLAENAVKSFAQSPLYVPDEMLEVGTMEYEKPRHYLRSVIQAALAEYEPCVMVLRSGGYTSYMGESIEELMQDDSKKKKKRVSKKAIQ